MHIDHLLPLALLAGPALARPSPPRRQYTNTTLPGITQTFTDDASSTAASRNTPRCTAEYVIPNSRDCGEIALAHGIELGVYESYYPAFSRHCQEILRGYGICPVKRPTTASPSAFPTANSITSGSNYTAPSNGSLANNATLTSPNGTTLSNGTLSNASLNFTRFDASVLATSILTSYDTKTLTYTIGTGAAADARTVVVTHTMSDTVTFTTMATVVGIADESKAKPTPSPTLVPARVVLQVLPEGTSTLTTEYQEHGTYTALTIVDSTSGANVKRQAPTCVGDMAVAVEPTASPANERRQVPTCANAVSAPAPTASGAVVGCSQWHVVVPGESCATIATEYGISAATFKTWNPALDASCYNLLTGIAYCVSRCGLTSEASSSSVVAAGVYTSAALSTASSWMASRYGSSAATLPKTASFNDGMYTPPALSTPSAWIATGYSASAALYHTTSAVMAGMYPQSTASVWMASGYAPKSYSPKGPKYPHSGMAKVAKSTQSVMMQLPKSTQSVLAQAPQSMPSSMGFPGFAFPSFAWNGFGGGKSFATPTQNALPPASSTSTSKPVLPFMAPYSPSVSAPKLEVPAVHSSKLEISQNYSSNPVPYKTYSGDGSVAAGWPSMEQWLDFETLFEINKPTMLSGCATWGVPNDSEDEIASIKSAIKSVAASADGIDERFVLAIIMQESKGCVRVVTTSWAHNNPGLMQTHQGTGSCNTPTVQTPCPDSEILQMVKDGTLGTSAGDGLQQCKQKQAAGQPDEVSAWYRTARQYNGGSIAASGNLEEGCCTLTYASDVANRLTGWVHPLSNSA